MPKATVERTWAARCTTKRADGPGSQRERARGLARSPAGEELMHSVVGTATNIRPCLVDRKTQPPLVFESGIGTPDAEDSLLDPICIGEKMALRCVNCGIIVQEQGDQLPLGWVEREIQVSNSFAAKVWLCLICAEEVAGFDGSAKGGMGAKPSKPETHIDL